MGEGKNNSFEQVELFIPSDLKYLGAVDALVQDLAHEFSFSNKCSDDISIAIIEACTNAIEHGNRFSKMKKVRMRIDFKKGSIVARVYDEGNGFDYKAHLAKKAPPDLLREKGRGILIMKAFSDKVEFRFQPGKGLCVKLTKNKSKDEAGKGI